MLQRNGGKQAFDSLFKQGNAKDVVHVLPKKRIKVKMKDVNENLRSILKAGQRGGKYKRRVPKAGGGFTYVYEEGKEKENVLNKVQEVFNSFSNEEMKLYKYLRAYYKKSDKVIRMSKERIKSSKKDFPVLSKFISINETGIVTFNKRGLNVTEAANKYSIPSTGKIGKETKSLKEKFEKEAKISEKLYPQKVQKKIESEGGLVGFPYHLIPKKMKKAENNLRNVLRTESSSSGSFENLGDLLKAALPKHEIEFYKCLSLLNRSYGLWPEETKDISHKFSFMKWSANALGVMQDIEKKVILRSGRELEKADSDKIKGILNQAAKYYAKEKDSLNTKAVESVKKVPTLIKAEVPEWQKRLSKVDDIPGMAW